MNHRRTPVLEDDLACFSPCSCSRGRAGTSRLAARSPPRSAGAALRGGGGGGGGTYCPHLQPLSGGLMCEAPEVQGRCPHTASSHYFSFSPIFNTLITFMTEISGSNFPSATAGNFTPHGGIRHGVVALILHCSMKYHVPCESNHIQ